MGTTCPIAPRGNCLRSQKLCPHVNYMSIRPPRKLLAQSKRVATWERLALSLWWKSADYNDKLKEMTPNMQGGGGGVSPAALRTRVKGKLREGRVADPGDGEGVRMHFREVMRFHGQLYFTIIILPIASR